jgi:hypothetical protein
MAHFANSLRRGNHVWLLRHLHRRGHASGMRARDPKRHSATRVGCCATALSLPLSRAAILTKARAKGDANAAARIHWAR